MLRFWILVFFISAFGIQAQVPVNTSMLNGCATALVNCSNSSNNCTQTFNSCLSSAQQNLRPPQSCYQARAAKIALKVTFFVTMSVALITLVVIPVLSGLLPYISHKISCCKDAGLKEIMYSEPAADGIKAVPIDPTSNPGKAIASKMIMSLGIALGGIVNYATFTSLYSSWQFWTNVDANCKFDIFAPISTVGDLKNNEV